MNRDRSDGVVSGSRPGAGDALATADFVLGIPAGKDAQTQILKLAETALQRF